MLKADGDEGGLFVDCSLLPPLMNGSRVIVRKGKERKGKKTVMRIEETGDRR